MHTKDSICIIMKKRENQDFVIYWFNQEIWKNFINEISVEMVKAIKKSLKLMEMKLDKFFRLNYIF